MQAKHTASSSGSSSSSSVRSGNIWQTTQFNKIEIVLFNIKVNLWLLKYLKYLSEVWPAGSGTASSLRLSSCWNLHHGDSSPRLPPHTPSCIPLSTLAWLPHTYLQHWTFALNCSLYISINVKLLSYPYSSYFLLPPSPVLDLHFLYSISILHLH